MIKIKNILRPIRNKVRHVVREKFSNQDITKYSARLHLGCGHIRLPLFCNIDISYTPATDVIDNVKYLKRFPNNYAEEIYACHVLEHFAHEEVLPILKRWYTVLKPGGVIRISVPDIDLIVKIYTANWQHFQTEGNSPWIGLLYGGQGDPYDFHKTGFNFCWLKFLMQQASFHSIAEYPHEPHFAGDIQDGSLARLPFDDFLSLNILGYK
jgi:SAM-dependent methyltransferase